MNKTRRLIATGALALAAAGTAVVAAPAASAAVANGDYIFTTFNFDTPSSAPASVRDGVLTLYSPLGPIPIQIIDTPDGGYIDALGQRYILGGETFLGPWLIGHNTLTPR